VKAGNFSIRCRHAPIEVDFEFVPFRNVYLYNARNWLVALPVNAFLSGIWPIDPLILHLLFRHQHVIGFRHAKRDRRAKWKSDRKRRAGAGLS
jgi:hypothetical protein